MAVFDNVEDIFQDIRGLGECAKALVTFATAIGSMVIIYQTLKFTFKLTQGFRLYVLSQVCCKTDFKNKYGKWAVISGSTDGIGLALARDLARRGMSIIVIGRNEEKLARTKVSLEGEPNVGEVVTVKIDLSDSSIENFASIRTQIDPDNRDIGILINNAGSFPDKFMRFNRFDMEFMRSMVNINILATLHLTRMIMPGMVERGRGLVVNVSSTFGYIPAPYVSVYGPTKSFINSFTRQLQIEYSSHPIDIINLAPGAVHTNAFTGAWSSTISKPTPFNPSPDVFAQSALNAMSTRIGSLSGTMLHGISKESMQFFDCLGLVPSLLRMNMAMVARNYQLSPVPKRRRPTVSAERPESERTF